MKACDAIIEKLNSIVGKCTAFTPSITNKIAPLRDSGCALLHGGRHERFVPMRKTMQRKLFFGQQPSSVDNGHLSCFSTVMTNRSQNRNERGSSGNKSSSLYSSASSKSYSNDTTSSPTTSKSTYIRPYLRALFLMCRPVNFPIVVFFHILGVHQIIQLWRATYGSSSSSLASSSHLLLPLLTHPSMLMVLLSLLLVTSTSMITNDYYDARYGVDSAPSTSDAININGQRNNNKAHYHYHPLAQGLVPFSIAKTFDSYLYAILLLSSAFVPGIIPRLMVIGGAITTYLYTVHLKPRTWVKNLSCAALVSMSPVTSGLAAWHVLRCGGYSSLLGSQDVGTVAAAAVGGGASYALPCLLLLKSQLTYFVVALFSGIMSREILMDITDCDSDARAGIVTVPVKHGKQFASGVALGWSFLSAAVACMMSFITWIPRFCGEIRRIGRGGGVGTIVDFVSLSSFGSVFGSMQSFVSSMKYFLGFMYTSVATIFANSELRKLLLSLVGSGMLLRRAHAVWRTKGKDVNLAERAIRESLVSVLLVLASFV